MMKSKIIHTGIILLLTITVSIASSIDGLWEVNRSGELVEIRTTDYGLKAKFLNSRDWDHYELLRRNIYEDRKGNRYHIKTTDRITWESRDGRRVINLEKSRNRNGAFGRSGEYEYDYGDRRRGRTRSHTDHHVCSASCGPSCDFRTVSFDDGVSGTWTNRFRDLIAYIEYDGYNLRMKTNRSRKWTTYRRTNSRKLVFEDRWGNRIKLKNNGRMQWKRADRGRTIDLQRHYY